MLTYRQTDTHTHTNTHVNVTTYGGNTVLSGIPGTIASPTGCGISLYLHVQDLFERAPICRTGPGNNVIDCVPAWAWSVYSRDKLSQALSRFSMRKATESWAGPGKEAKAIQPCIADREPTKDPRVHYCYSTALQNGSEYAENRILRV